MEKQQIEELLARLRRRTLWVGGVAGMGWGLLAALACLFTGAWLDLLLEFPPALRVSTLWVAGVAATLLMIVVLRAARHAGLPLRLARNLDRLAKTGGQIASGVQLAAERNPSAYSSDPILTASLSKNAVRAAAQLAKRVKDSEAAPVRPIHKSFTAFAVSAFVMFVLILFAPRLAQTQWRRLVDPYGDNPPFSRIHFQVTPEGAEVLYGSGLDVKVSVEGGETDHVELVLVGGKTASAEEIIPMFEEGTGKWRSTIANVRDPVKYFVRSRRVRSPKYDLRVVTVPRIEDVRFRVIPPPYAGLAEYEGPLPQGGLAGLPGTQVEITAISNRPLSGGRISVVVGETTTEVTMKTVPGRVQEAIGRITMKSDGQLEVAVVDVENQESVENFSAPIILLPDQRPFVRLLEPQANSFATPTAILPVVMSGEDDYGVSRLELYRSLNDSRPLPRSIFVATPPPKTTYNVEHLPLSAYGLQPGDEIKLFARITDNDPVGGLDNIPGKGSESSVVVVRIISEEEFQSFRRAQDSMQLLMSKYQEAQRRMESLADEIEQLQKELKKELEKDPAGSKLSEEIRKKLEQLTKRITEEKEALEKLAKDKLPYDLDKQLNPHLEEMRDTLQRLEKRAKALANNAEATNKQAEQELDDILKELREKQERLDTEAMESLEALESVFRLAVDENRYLQLYRKQRGLADRLAAMKDRDGEDDPVLKARMRDLEEEQRALREELADLLDDIEEHAEQLPKDLPEHDDLKNSALEFAEKVRNSGADEAMKQCEGGLSDFSGTEGHTGAKEAADILAKFIDENGNGGNGSMGKQGMNSLKKFQPRIPGRGDGMCKTLGQLLADAGFGGNPGSSGGFGAGGGSSSRMSAAKNVGLYGGVPQASSQASRQGGRSDQTTAAQGRARERQVGGAGDGSFDSSETLEAAGSGEAAVPLRYRRKVGRYFQRIADELGER